jgi:hypothetical protein
MSRITVPTFYGVPGKMTRRLGALVIGTQGLAVFFGALVARALAAAEDSPASSTFLLMGSLLAFLCLVDAAAMRWPWGVTLGWVLQIATLACALVVPVMLVVGLLFGALWTSALVQGALMDEHTREVDARWHARSQTSGSETSGSETSGAEGPAAEGSGPQAPATDG